MSGYSIIRADEVKNPYAGSEVPGEFRSLKDPLAPLGGLVLSSQPVG